MKKKVSNKKPVSRDPLSDAAITRWFKLLDYSGDKHPHINARLRTVDSTLSGILEALSKAGAKPKSLRPLIELALDTHHPVNSRPYFRPLVVCDWSVRSALPDLLDRCPARYKFSTWAGRLRRLPPMLWSVSALEALIEVLKLSDELYELPQNDRIECREVLEYIKAIAMTTTAALSGRFGMFPSGDSVAWIADRACAASGLKPSIESLFRVVVAAEPGRSIDDVARKCVWSKAS